jgi:7-cyano-7-deazaguanine synthase
LTKPILLFSGGLDSTTLLWQLKPNVKALIFNYGQRHVTEIDHASHLASKAGVEFEIADVRGISHLLAKGSQTGFQEVPEGHYAAENMKTTVVPNRNMIMLAIAAGWAISTEAKSVYTAVHAGDHTIYPDCRPDFIQALGSAIHLGNWEHVKLIAPFVNSSKADIVKAGSYLKVPYELTWSCYKGKLLHCGKCGTCVERKEAFKLAGVEDPTQYEA